MVVAWRRPLLRHEVPPTPPTLTAVQAAHTPQLLTLCTSHSHQLGISWSPHTLRTGHAEGELCLEQLQLWLQPCPCLANVQSTSADTSSPLQGSAQYEAGPVCLHGNSWSSPAFQGQLQALSMKHVSTQHGGPAPGA